MSEQPKTKKEIEQSRIALLEAYGGPYCGEVYEAARNMFNRFGTLRQVEFRFTQDDAHDFMFSADQDSRLVTVNANPESKLNERMLQRLRDRFRLSKEVVEFMELQPGAARPLILAHELAHILQVDPLFAQTYGADFDNYPPPLDKDYRGYILSDSEVNADYIAASIVSNTTYGLALGIDMPDFEPSHWREWGAERQMSETIARFGGAQLLEQS